MREAKSKKRATWTKAILLMAFLAVASASVFPAQALMPIIDVIGDCASGPVTCQLIDNWTGQVVSEGFMIIIVY
ncbi:MAG: hypothetical protein MI919_37395 [Holophagales bacterium]|nr:hypothetical protein [Holophagales bacterium]